MTTAELKRVNSQIRKNLKALLAEIVDPNKKGS